MYIRIFILQFPRSIMISLYVILVVLTSVLDPGLPYILVDDSADTLVFPTEYHFRGEIVQVTSGIIEPFEIWYSAEYNTSRIDYNGGTVKRYYVAENDEDYGQEYEIYPVTTEETTNVITCDESRGKSEQKNFLPTADNYTYEGVEIYNNKQLQIWKSLKSDEDETDCEIEETWYVDRRDLYDVPVKYENRKHNHWIGTLVSYSIIRYFDFRAPKHEDLDVTLEAACKDSIDKFSPPKESAFHPLLLTDVDSAFHSFKIQHSRNFEVSEHELRKSIFKENWRRVIEHNRQNLTYKMTINKFSDRTPEELQYLTGTRSSNSTGSMPFPYTEEELEKLAQNLPENYDMRLEGVISPVKDQSKCGSCWSFSTTAAVEGALARINGGRNVDLSEQSLVDCSWGYLNRGCQGGFLDRAYKYVNKHGIPTQQEYGLYLAEDGYCELENMTMTYTIRGFSKITALSTNAMKVALYHHGPVSVGVNAEDSMFSYHSGIYYNPECNKEHINHAVTVVGYGVRDGSPYWIVKNSWGENWGEDGYLLISSLDNNCHLLEEAYYPNI